MTISNEKKYRSQVREYDLGVSDHLWVIDGRASAGGSALELKIVQDIFSDYLNQKPEFVRNVFGKPELDDSDGRRLYFNLSHSFSVIALLISADAPVGIDIEQIRERKMHKSIAKRYFSAAEQSAMAQDFYRSWTAREAFIKAQGSGLAKDLSRIKTRARDYGMDIGLSDDLTHRVTFASHREYLIAICRERSKRKNVKIFNVQKD